MGFTWERICFQLNGNPGKFGGKTVQNHEKIYFSGK
jgi:hypothetical protein